jgi:hypothetical protein
VQTLLPERLERAERKTVGVVNAAVRGRDSHVFVKHGGETFPGFLEGVDAVAGGPPLDAAAAHDKSP